MRIWRKKIGRPSVSSDAERRGEEERRQEEQRERSEARGRRAYLTRNCQPFGCRRPRRHEREAAEVLHLRQLGHALEQARDDRRRDAEILAAADDAEQDIVRARSRT